jgi:hypothetical protein
MTTTTTTHLANKNPHPRDTHIHFDEGPHKYTIQGINGVTAETEFTSVTTLVHDQYERFNAKDVIAGMMRNKKKWNDPVANHKYYGKTADEIEKMWAKSGQDAAAKGTAMHAMIECFYNTDDAPTADATADPATATDPLEIIYFKKFHNDFVACDQPTLRPYRTEWTVFHEEARIAGSIDMVYEDLDPARTVSHSPSESRTGSRRWGADPPPIVIYDWKRCREITKTHPLFKFASHPAIEHLPDTNFWHYALQLNIYKYILQTKYNKTVTDLYLVVLHPEAQNYQRIKLPNLQSEVTELFEERIRNFAAAVAK